MSKKSTIKNLSCPFNNPINSENFNTVSKIFKCLANPIRVHIFWILSHEEECVVNLSTKLNMSSPAIFHHLQILHECGLITNRRCGKEVYYKTASNEECELLHKAVEKIMTITCPKIKENYQASSQDIVHIIHEHLLDHLDVRITIDNLSKQYLINPTTLKEEFKKIYGSSIASHMNEHRMEQAARLLVSTNKNIYEISKSVGYESQSRFTTVFKNTYNLPPTEFRKKYDIKSVEELINKVEKN